MGTENFCLKWNDFESNMVTAFKNLRSDNEFFDTTLGCYDSRGRVLKAHKVILSACSPFFRNILKMSTGYPHPNPFIYLRGVSYNDLQCLLDFMYHGEVKVAQEDLNSFLAIAEELQIKGLTNKSGGGGSSGGGEETTAKKPICPETADSEEPPMKKEKWDGNTGEFVSDNTQTQAEGGGDFAMDNGQEAGQGQDDGNEGSMLDQVMSAGTGDEHQGSTGTGGGETSGGEEGQIEKVIGDNTTVIKLPAPEGPLDEEKLVYRSIEFLLDGNAKCKMCGKTFTSGPNVRRHIRTIHLNDGQINFHCFLCNKGFTMQRYLKNHLKTHQLTKEEIAALLPAATSTLTIPQELQ